MFRRFIEEGAVTGREVVSDKSDLHTLTRRQFLLSSAAVSVAAAAALATPIPARAAPLGAEGARYHNFKRALRTPVFTASPAFGNPYPLIAWQEDDPLAPVRMDGGSGPRVVAISGIPHAPASLGRAGVAHVAAVLEADDPDRLTTPLRRTGPRGSGQYQAATWDQALAELAPELARARPTGTVILTGPRAPTTLWNRFARTLATPHHFTLGFAAGRAKVWQAVWGVEAPVADVARAGLVLDFGANFLRSHPEWGANLMQGRSRFGTRLISIDPRLSRTAAAAERWIPIRPGTDALLARALAAQMVWNESADVTAAAKLGGLDPKELGSLLDDTDLDAIAEATGLPLKTLEALGDEVSRIRPLTVIAGAGAIAHSGGGAPNAGSPCSPYWPDRSKNREDSRNPEASSWVPSPPSPPPPRPTLHPPCQRGSSSPGRRLTSICWWCMRPIPPSINPPPPCGGAGWGRRMPSAPRLPSPPGVAKPPICATGSSPRPTGWSGMRR